MKHYLIISIISVISLLSIFVNTIKLAKTHEDQNHGINTSEHKVYYTLKDYGGQIGLFSNERESPLQVYDIFTDSLPEDDKIMIENGITASSREELQKIIEEYTS